MAVLSLGGGLSSEAALRCPKARKPACPAYLCAPHTHTDARRTGIGFGHFSYVFRSCMGEKTAAAAAAAASSSSSSSRRRSSSGNIAHPPKVFASNQKIQLQSRTTSGGCAKAEFRLRVLA